MNFQLPRKNNLEFYENMTWNSWVGHIRTEIVPSVTFGLLTLSLFVEIMVRK